MNILKYFNFFFVLKEKLLREITLKDIAKQPLREVFIKTPHLHRPFARPRKGLPWMKCVL